MWFKRLALACVAALLALSSTTASSAAERAITDTSRSPHVKPGSVDLDDVRWTDGFWADRVAVCRARMLPRLIELVGNSNNGAVYRNFRVAAGLEQGQFAGRRWGDGDFYKVFEAAITIHGADDDETLGRWIDEVQ